jgi:predicted amidohydrolase YtcJ
MERALENGLPETSDSYIRQADDGAPNGILHELFYALPIPALSPEAKRRAVIEVARRELLARGVTAIGEISDSVDGLNILADATESGDLPLWIRAFVWAPGTLPLKEVLDPGIRSRLPKASPEKFDILGLKIFVDGGISSMGAALLKPYKELRDGRPNFGRLAYSRGELMEIIRRADDLGLQVAAHVNGEYAQRMLCQAIIDTRGRDRSGRLPVRLEHAGNMLTEVETMDFWRRAGAVPITQASGIWHSAPFVADYAGDYMKSGLRMIRTMLDDGWDVSSSSDASGSENLVYSPLFGVQEAVTRQACTGEILVPGERVSVMEALRMHTAAPARDLGVSADLGSIESGKRADLVVLGADPRECDPGQISNIDIERVYIAGRRFEN